MKAPLRVRFVTIAVLIASPACDGAPASDGTAVLDVVDVLTGAEDDGFERAGEGYDFQFPRDHGAHPAFRTEWWYVTGNVRDGSGNPFGFQFTVFRSALSAIQADSTSAWDTNQAYMAHLAITSASTDDHRSFERIARGAAGLAGAAAEPFRVWLEGWEIASSQPGSFWPLRVRARDDGVALDLHLTEGKPMVFHGDRGLSAKSSELGNASYYYSFTRVPVSGSIEIDGLRRQVSGSAWMDREWSSSVLSPDQTGWDWYSLQLDDGRDLMYFRLRGDEPSRSTSDGTLVDPLGRARRLRADDVELAELETWTNPEGSATYPVRWRMRLPEEGLDVILEPLVLDQEVRHLFRYWEGAVRVLTVEEGEPIGAGYVEMTGYARPPTSGSANGP